ncbi:MAG: M48 family metalloprotease [Desulfobacteraceae bacterium]|jgi:predicted Zn-dependent protease
MNPFFKFLSLLMAMVLLAICWPRPHAQAITIREEEEMSREFLKVVGDHFEIINDSMANAYVREIGAKVLATVPSQHFNYQFHIVRENVYNAFATPAGHIFINSGLIAAMESEEELAGILGHEIAHVVCRHISQKIERSKKVQLATLAGVAAGVFLGIGGAGSPASALTVGSMAAGQSAMLAYSREDEIQADQVGLKYLNEAGYSGQGIIDVLKKMRAKQWYDNRQIPNYLMTHPATEDRIAYVDRWVAHQEPGTPLPAVDPYPFHRTQARLIAVYGDQEAALNRFEAALAAQPGDPVTHYGYGLALARSGNRREAIVQLRAALAHRALDPYILRDLGGVYFQDGQYAQALKILQGSAAILPEDPEARLLLGRTQLEMDRLADAVATFEALLAQTTEDPQVYYQLAQAYGKLGQMGDAHYYLGVYYNRQKEHQNAVFHLEKARETITDPQKSEQISNLLKVSRRAALQARQAAERTP